jgi:hypothetical protein
MRLLLILFLASAACRAEIIDRVAVVVGNSVITESEILREIRLAAFLNGEPTDFSVAAKRKTADRLVERRLIRTEINVSLYPAPEADALEQMIKDVQARLGSPERYKRELERTGLTEDEVKAHLREAVGTLRFLDFRFRPGTQIGEDEIRKYFDDVLQPQLRNGSPGAEFALGDYHKQVEDALIADHVDKASDAWLKETRDHTRIEFRSAVFAEPHKQEASK